MVRRAVAVLFAVGLIVLVVVRNEIAQREAVMRRHEVDRRRWRPAGFAVHVRTAGKTRREIVHRTGLTAPEVAHRVAIPAVPLAPAAGEVANLVSAHRRIPWL